MQLKAEKEYVDASLKTKSTTLDLENVKNTINLVY